MNKTILKLFNDAGFHQPEMERLGIEHKFEKFAELIVSETIDQLAQQIENHGIYQANNRLLYNAFEKTLQHFGIDE